MLLSVTEGLTLNGISDEKNKNALKSYTYLLKII